MIDDGYDTIRPITIKEMDLINKELLLISWLWQQSFFTVLTCLQQVVFIFKDINDTSQQGTHCNERKRCTIKAKF